MQAVVRERVVKQPLLLTADSGRVWFNCHYNGQAAGRQSSQ